MEYPIVILDIGGTILDKNFSNIVDSQIIQDIVSLRNKGIKVGLCTMRTKEQCEKSVPTPLDFYICLNGSYIVCDSLVIHNQKIKVDPSIEYCLTYDTEKVYYKNEGSLVLADKYGYVVDKQGMLSNASNLVIFNVDKDDLGKYNEYHYEYWPKNRALMLQHKDSSKARAINKILDYYSIKQNILFFGDGPNDLEIFKQFKDCICMGSCYIELENYALFKTETVANGGVPKALRKLKIL